MNEITDKLELWGICMDKANAILDDSIPDEYYLPLITDIDRISDAGYDELFVLAHSFFARDENRKYNVECRGFMGASPAAYCCGLTQADPLRSGDDIPIYPELFYGFYQDRKKLPFFLDIGTLPKEKVHASKFFQKLSETGKWEMFATDNLRMLDILEAEIGCSDESRQYDGEKLAAYWLDAFETYGEDFKPKVLNLFPDFLSMDPSGLDLLIRLLKQQIPLNRKNLSRIIGILHGLGATKNAYRMLEEGISFDTGICDINYIAYPEDIYDYLKGYLPEDDAVPLSLRISLERRSTDGYDMYLLMSHGVPIPIIRRMWMTDHLYSAVQCYAHAGEFLRLAWYYENCYDDYIRLFCS